MQVFCWYSQDCEKKVFADRLDRGAPARGGFAVACCRNDAINVPLGDLRFWSSKSVQEIPSELIVREIVEDKKVVDMAGRGQRRKCT